MELKRLLIMACSHRKRPVPDLLPAIERYDGPTFRVLRKFLLEQPAEAQFVEIFILSAKFGLIPANYLIPNYDYKMSQQQAHQLQPKVILEFGQVLQATCYSELFINLGQNYWLALAGYERLVPPKTKIIISQGSQGGRQAALRRWLYNNLIEEPNDHPIIAQPNKARVRGVEITLTPEQVLNVARHALAEGQGDSNNYQSSFVVVDSQRVAPKWLVSQLTGLPLGSFHTGDAVRVLEQLGIRVRRI